MKKIMMLVAAACVLACNGKEAKYEITGQNAPEDGVTVYLVDKLTDSRIASAVVADGAFLLKGKADKDAFLSVQIEGWDWHFPLFNDGTPVAIDCADSTFTGSALNTQLCVFDKQDAATLKGFNQFIQDFMALPREEQQAREAAFMVQYQEKLEACGQLYENIIEENQDNLIPVAFLKNVAVLSGKEKFDEFMASGAPYTQHPYAVDLKRQLDEADAKEKKANDGKTTIIGQQFLDLEEADPDGNLHKLSEYVGQGKWVLVDFWASWCGPCKAEMPNVVAAYKKYHPKGFDIVGISFDKEKEPWVQAIKEWDMPWIHLSDLQYWRNAASALYKVNSIPDNLLIDPEGKVVARGLRGKDLEARLSKILQ